jgi:outer membrane protein OmpA-like peptidoglycan-associated protein
MDCIPGCVQIILTNPTITINPQESTSTSTNTPTEGQNPTEKDPEVPEPPTTPTPVTPQAPTVHFNTASSAISAEDRALLDAFAKDLLNDPGHSLRITGHTDNVGSSESNMLLSKKRAEAVYNYLLQKGVPADQLDLRYNGEENPVYDNTTPEGRWMNRRTEVEIIR